MFSSVDQAYHCDKAVICNLHTTAEKITFSKSPQDALRLIELFFDRNKDKWSRYTPS